jgi:hypothetical protein
MASRLVNGVPSSSVQSAPSVIRPIGSVKIKLERVSYFLDRKKCSSTDHVYHAFHHKNHHKNMVSTHVFFKKPQQKR